MDLNDPFTLHAADARNMSTLMPLLGDDAEPLDCTITSPPYWNIKDYDQPDQIGFGQSYDEYLAAMGEVFRGLRPYEAHGQPVDGGRRAPRQRGAS